VFAFTIIVRVGFSNGQRWENIMHGLFLKVAAIWPTHIV